MDYTPPASLPTDNVPPQNEEAVQVYVAALLAARTAKKRPARDAQKAAWQALVERERQTK